MKLDEYTFEIDFDVHRNIFKCESYMFDGTRKRSAEFPTKCRLISRPYIHNEPNDLTDWQLLIVPIEWEEKYNLDGHAIYFRKADYDTLEDILKSLFNNKIGDITITKGMINVSKTKIFEDLILKEGM